MLLTAAHWFCLLAAQVRGGVNPAPAGVGLVVQVTDATGAVADVSLALKVYVTGTQARLLFPASTQNALAAVSNFCLFSCALLLAGYSGSAFTRSFLTLVSGCAALPSVAYTGVGTPGSLETSVSINSTAYDVEVSGGCGTNETLTLPCLMP